MWLSQFLPLLSILSLAASAPTTTSILSLDLGSQFIKTSLLKPGRAFDVLLDRDSKRKIFNGVYLNGQEEYKTGGSAESLLTRWPERSFPNLQLLLDGEGREQWEKVYGKGRVVVGEDGRIKVDGERVEELLSLQLAYFKGLAESELNHGRKEGEEREKVKDVVVTVPAYFAQSERQVIKDALSLSGLRLISFVKDGTAAAVNFALTSTVTKPTIHILYDAGSSSTKVTLIKLLQKEVPSSHLFKDSPLKNVTTVEVLGNAWSRTGGGLEIERRLASLLLEDFVAQSDVPEESKVKAKESKRVAMRLLKEAGRVKSVLSANSEAVSRVEALVDDFDLKTAITRERLEQTNADLVPGFKDPIVQVLATANLTVDDIESLILVGGNSRVPLVQQTIKEVVPEQKIAVNLNADEAAVLGAAIYGAAQSRQFKTQDVRVEDVSGFDVIVAYESDPKAGSEIGKTFTSTLFKKTAKLGTKKTLTVKKANDFELSFGYKFPSGNVFEYAAKLTGLSTATKSLDSEKKANSTVKVTVELDESGILSVSKATAVVPVSESDITEKLQKFLETKKQTGEEADKEKDEAVEKAVEDFKKSIEKTSNIDLKIEWSPVKVKALSKEDKKASQTKVKALQDAEHAKMIREETRNVVEAMCYKVREYYSDEEFIAHSTEEARLEIQKVTDTAMDWLIDNGEKATTEELSQHKSAIEKVVLPVTHRMTETKFRDAAIEDFSSGLLKVLGFLQYARDNQTRAEATFQTPIHTKGELDWLERHMFEEDAWLRQMIEKQKSVAKHEEPVLEIAEMRRRLIKILKEMDNLWAKKPQKPSKSKTSKSSASSSSTTSTSTSSQSSPTSETSSTPGRDEL